MSAQSTELAPLRARDRPDGLSCVGVALQDARVEGSAARPGSDGGEFFAACVAHELRTPLTTQRALLELALADPDAGVGSWREIGEDVLAACRQLERLLEACLTLARSKSGLERCEPVDLAVITADVLRSHDLGRLESVVALEPACMSGDPDLLERLVANLVSNAIRHNIADGCIELATRIESGRAVLAVANTGPLVPPDELRRLFQPFQRLNASPRSLSDGVGLGLAIVDTIAGAHDAIINPRARTAGGLDIQVSFRATTVRRAEPGMTSSAAASGTGHGRRSLRRA